MEVKEIVSMADYDAAIGESGLTAIKFGSSWCSPCKMLGDTLRKMDDMDNVHVYEVDIDSDAGVVLCEKHNIMSIPVVMLFKNKEMVFKSIGSVSKEKLISLINEHA